MTKARQVSAAVLFVALFTLGMGCELISTVDRGKIDQANTGGQGGGGTAGTGGIACVPEDDHNECTDDTCNADGSPAHTPKPPGAPCATGGSLCDESGQCVECIEDADCSGEETACQRPACDAGACGFDFTAAGTAVPTQSPGDCKLAVCDGNGAIVDEDDDSDGPDDDNDCTADTCVAGMPTHTPLAQGTDCSVPNGAPLVCDDAGNCVGCNAADDCPGSDDECKTRSCVNEVCGFDYAPVNTLVMAQTDGDCLKQVCDGAGKVIASPDNADVPPDDGDSCTSDLCSAGAPIHPNKMNGTLCNDGSACTQLDTCQNGTCTGALPVMCKALDQCHTPGVCDAATGLCSNPDKADGAPCNDGDACSQGDTCLAGACAAGTPITCSASDQCHTAGTCNPVSGLCSNPPKANGAACDDSNPCTQTDACQVGQCVGGNPITCTAQDQCHLAGTCDPATGACSNPNKANGTVCNDNSACTQNETCQSGACTPATTTTCTPVDQCHVAGTCNPANGICSNPNKANGSACSDGNGCTQTDVCQNGACSGSNPVVCTAQDQCHNAGTCAPATGLCSNPNKANGTACNDSNACTQTDTCQAGTCTGQNPKTCAAQDQCHDAGTCDPMSGVCSAPTKADGTSCNDGNACTQTDACSAGVCSGANPITCSQLDACHVVGTCNTATGVCSNPNAPDGLACVEAGVSGACANGVCGGCGDGTLGAGELCDDGNFVNGDGCDTNCTPTMCGNGVVTMGELCDDGNLTVGDGCDDGMGGNCTPTMCGNGIVTIGESCDDGDLTNGDGCDDGIGGNCTPSGCGNGVVTMGESCDDGNLTSGDGCDDGLGGNCTPSGCGNGVVTMGETCDDGNVASGDGCDANCKPTGCGNGIIAGSETCDDNNTLDNDGCSRKCLTEVPYTCVGTPSVCTSTAEINCNDGKDNDNDGLIDCADSNCALGCNVNVGPCGPGETMLVYTATDLPKPIPDNVAGPTSNIVVGGAGQVQRVVVQTNIAHTYDEDVDITLRTPSNITADVSTDNGTSTDNFTDTIFNTACAASVTTGTGPFNGCYRPETPFTVYRNHQAKGTWSLNATDDASGIAGTLNAYRLTLCVVQTSCGDGVVDPGETCDDGNPLSGDACDPNCTPQGCGNGIATGSEGCDDGNLTSGDGCDSNCKVTACGNGVLTAGEVCDDGNVVNNDGCDSNCKPTGCGNGVVTTGEICDDGNVVNGDGCDFNCKPTACGNGALSAGEDCDDANTVNGDSCDSNCKAPSCGNGVVSPGETCDDGNLVAGDGCDATCLPETNYVCVGTASSCAPLCGNSTLTPPEQCDDGNLSNNDGCDGACATETAFTEVEPNGTRAEADTNALGGLVIATPSTMISGAITPTGDKDIFKVVLPIAGVARFETFDTSGNDCTAANIPAAMKLSVLNAAGTALYTDTTTHGIGLCSAIVANLLPGTYYVQVEKNASGTIAAYKLQVKLQLSRGNETESNDALAVASGLAGSDVYIFGGHQFSGDPDWFQVNVPAGKSIRAEVIEGNAETCELLGVDSHLYLVGPGGAALGNIDDGGRGYCSLLDGTGATPTHGYAHNLAAGTYFIRVEAHAPLTNTPQYQFDYRLVVTIR